MYIYEGCNMGTLYTKDTPLIYDRCNRDDVLIGNFEKPEDFLKHFADEIYCGYEETGGWDFEYVFKNVLKRFPEVIDKEKAIEIIKKYQKIGGHNENSSR